MALTPARILDTRQPGSGGIIAANTARDIQITGLGGVPTSGVLAVVVDLSVVSTAADGWGLLMLEAGTTRPFPASSINAATSKVSAAGKVSYYTYGGPAGTAQMERVIRAAVDEVNNRRLSVLAVLNSFEGHEICSDSEYANGFSLAKGNSFHPNSPGHEKLAKDLEGYLAQIGWRP